MRQSTVMLLLILAGTLFASWFFTTHEKVTSIQLVGYRGEARFNDFLAAEMLLNELGIDSDSRPSLIPSRWLPGTGDSLVTRLSSTFSTGIERALLIEWVQNGGHLFLLPAAYDSAVIDDFLEQLGYRLTRIEPDPAGAAGEESDEPERVYTYYIDLDSTIYRIEVLAAASPSAAVTDEKGAIIARHGLGTGYVTVIASPNYFVNSQIDESDHARLLMDVVAGYVDPQKVWFIYDASFPTLWQVIWEKAPFAVIGVGMTIIIWLWSIVPKFGPAILPDPPVRRSIMEHVRAAGHFVWRHAGARFLATSSVAAIMHEAEYRHPGISRLPPQQQARLIARMTGLAEGPVMDVFLNRDEPRHREFTHNMQALQRMREEL